MDFGINSSLMKHEKLKGFETERQIKQKKLHTKPFIEIFKKLLMNASIEPQAHIIARTMENKNFAKVMYNQQKIIRIKILHYFTSINFFYILYEFFIKWKYGKNLQAFHTIAQNADSAVNVETALTFQMFFENEKSVVSSGKIRESRIFLFFHFFSQVLGRPDNIQLRLSFNQNNSFSEMNHLAEGQIIDFKYSFSRRRNH
eukprot:TRINITY_DN1165_c0_g2_i1.p2 TRINITY_DN1165_c0_g2~~TRINITY_DN1165_c0_g2_i1.p2  ORF type:complete len:201 (+),score=-2.85 TRINITY_DN1165_c0_g2_i1:743-1345(+)